MKIIYSTRSVSLTRITLDWEPSKALLVWLVRATLPDMKIWRQDCAICFFEIIWFHALWTFYYYPCYIGIGNYPAFKIPYFHVTCKNVTVTRFISDSGWQLVLILYFWPIIFIGFTEHCVYFRYTVSSFGSEFVSSSEVNWWYSCEVHTLNQLLADRSIRLSTDACW